MDDLFFLSAIRRYVASPRFVRRQWLVTEVAERMADPDCRFVLLTAEPGAGKSGFLAQLADDHPDWPRYLIRRDQWQPLADGSARAFLLRIGFQLAATHPELFSADQVRVGVQQHIGELGEGGSVIAAEVDRIVGSPFYQTILEIRQQVERAHGSVVGVHVSEWVTDPRLIPLSDLAAMALLDPLAALHRDQPSTKVVVLIDALDEVTVTGGEHRETVFDWLCAVGELPPNLRIIVTSRPNMQVRVFADTQRDCVQELAIRSGDERVDADLRAYARDLLALDQVAQALADAGRSSDDFARNAVRKADGNIGYLDAIGRAIDRAERRREPTATIAALVALDELPEDVHGLYAFFLHQLRARMSQRVIKVEDPSTGHSALLDVWSEVLRPVLEVLCVAARPLNLDELAGLTGTLARRAELTVALDQLAHLLDDSEDHRYRLYHATLVEFLTSPRTAGEPADTDLYVDPIAAHTGLAARIRSRLPDLWTDGEGAVETAVRRYGRGYYVLHLYGAQSWQELFRTLDQGDYGIGKLQADPTGAAYLSDLALGADGAARDGLAMTAAIGLLPGLFRYRLLSHLLSRTSDAQAPDIYAAWALLGHDERALRLASLVVNPAQRVKVLCRIAAALLDHLSEAEAAQGNQYLARAATAARSALAATVTIADEATALKAAGEVHNAWVRLFEHGQPLDGDLDNLIARYLQLAGGALPLADRALALVNVARLTSLTGVEHTRQYLARVTELATGCADRAQANRAWAQLAAVYADLRWLDKAAAAAAKIQDDAAYRLRMSAYVAKAYRESGDEAAAIAQVETAVPSVEPAPADAALRIAAARAWHAVGNRERAAAAALHAVDAIQSIDLPTPETVADLIRVLRELGENDSARNAAQRLHDCALATHREVAGGPTFAVYTIIAATALADVDEIGLALDIVHALSQHERGGAAVAVAEAYARMQDWDGALRVVELIRGAEQANLAFRISFSRGRTLGTTSDDALAAVGVSLANAGLADRAARLADQIQNVALRSAVSGAAARQEIKAGRSEAAYRLLEADEWSIRLAGARAFRHQVAKGGLCLLAAVREWSAAAAFAESVDAELPAARATVTLVGLLLRAGELAAARRLVDEIPDPGERAAQLIEYAKRLTDADPAAAATALAEARSLASTLPPDKRWYTLDAAAIALAKAGDTEAAQQALQDAITAWGEVLRIQSRPTPWCRLAGDCVRVGLYEKAVRIARGLPATGLWAFDRAQALVHIADALLEQDDQDRAVERLEEAVQEASLIGFPPQRTQTRGDIAARFAQLGMLSRALADDLSAEASDEIRQKVADRLGRSGRPEEALALYPSPQAPPDGILQAVVPTLLGQGRAETALSLINLITAPASRIALLVQLAEGPEPDHDKHLRLTAARSAANLMVNNISLEDPNLVADVARCLHSVGGARELLQVTMEQWRATRSARELAWRVPLATPLVAATTAREITSALPWAEEFLGRLARKHPDVLKSPGWLWLFVLADPPYRLAY